jgi:hypothetical protein
VRYTSRDAALLDGWFEERRCEMLAYRWTWIVKHGAMEELRELLQAEAKRFSPDYAKARVYTPDLSPNVIVYELTVENEEARRRFFEQYNATPGAPAFWEKWNSGVERQIATERWTVTELG